MKNVLTLILFAFIILGCKTKNKERSPKQSQYLTTYTFQVKTNNKEDLELFENGIIPWISIKNPKKELENLIGRDNILFRANMITLVIDYPLNHPTKIGLKPRNLKGFTREDLVLQISAEYNRIYKEEENTATTKTIPREERKGLFNRNETDGKYGIWGHDIDDLNLYAIVISISEKGDLIMELTIES